MLKYAGIKAFLGGIRPCVVGLILATASTMFLNAVIGFSNINDTLTIDFCGVLIFAILIAIAITAKLAFKKKPSPILMIVLSAGLGMLLYSL
jgi:chromate transporter